MLSHFSVKNYKCLADVSLDLTPIHVLIGQNDTGKTSLFEAIRASVSVAQVSGRTRSLIEVFNNLLRLDSGISELISHQARSKLIHFSFTHQRGGNTFPFDCILSVVEAENKTGAALPAQVANSLMANGYRLRPRVMARASVLRSHTDYALDEDGFGLPALLDEIQDYDIERFVAIQNDFRKYFPQFRRIRLENTVGWVRSYQDGYPFDMKGGGIAKQVWLAMADGEIRLQQASDGAILLLGFIALLHSPRPPSVLLIEEPENGLHPERLIEVAQLLRQFVEREENAPQIILTTHSPYLLSQFKPEEVTLMRRQPDGSAKAFPLRNAKHIQERMGNEFYLGELWYNLDEEELLK